MGLIDIAREDIAAFTADTDDFGMSMDFENSDASITAKVKGIFSRHHLGVNREGVAYNNRTAHVSVSKSVFAAADYPIVNDGGEIDFTGHKVTVDGIKYVVNEWLPGDTAALITIILGDYTDGD